MNRYIFALLIPLLAGAADAALDRKSVV